MCCSQLLQGVKRLGAWPLPTLLPALDKLSLLPEFLCDSFIMAILVTIMTTPAFQLWLWPFLSLSTQQWWFGCHGSSLHHILFHSGAQVHAAAACILAQAAYTSAEQGPHWSPSMSVSFCGLEPGGAWSHLPGAIKRMRGNGNGLKSFQERFRLNLRGKMFSGRAIKHWDRLHRQIIESPSLEVFKTMYLWPWGMWFSEELGSVG